jgi:hypothetical protein
MGSLADSIRSAERQVKDRSLKDLESVRERNQQRDAREQQRQGRDDKPGRDDHER